MDLTKDELQGICNQKEMIKENIAQMCLSDNYETLDLNCMLAKDGIEEIYKLLNEHLHDKYDKENNWLYRQIT